MALVTTSGGSLGDLTALLAARDRRFPGYWSRGGARLGGEGRLAAIAVGEEVHYGVSRAAGILGIGQDQVVPLPLNRRRQIDPDRAAESLRAAERAGLGVFCLVAFSGTTAVGAFDPLDELAAPTAAPGPTATVSCSNWSRRPGGTLFTSTRPTTPPSE